MSTEPRTSFSTFFKDDPFKDDADRALPEETIVARKQKDMRPRLEEPLLADDAAQRRYARALRSYFASGAKTGEGLTGPIIPALLAASANDQQSGLPVFMDEAGADPLTMRDLLRQAFNAVFKQESDAPILAQNLVRIERMANETVAANGGRHDFAMTMLPAMEQVAKLDVRGPQGDAFRADCRKLHAQLAKHGGTLLAFSPALALQLLDIRLATRKREREAFVGGLNRQLASLTELMRLQERKDSGSTASPSGLGAAEGLVSFDRVERMRPPSATSGLPEQRVKRVEACIGSLRKGLALLQHTPSRIFVRQALADKLGLKDHLTHAEPVIIESDPCGHAGKIHASALHVLTETIAATRMARLELGDKYDEDLHTPYFSAFGPQHLLAGDLLHLPELIVIEEAGRLTAHPDDMLGVLAAHMPVRIMALSTTGGLIREGVSSTTGARKELAPLALLHRNAFVAQVGTDDPILLNGALRDGLGASSPSVWNLLLPGEAHTGADQGLLAVRTAVAGRCFPLLIHDVTKGMRFGSRFDIAANPQPGRDHPIYPLEAIAPDGPRTLEIALTAADLLAMDAEVTAQLEVVPGMYRTDSMMPLDAYLSADPATLMGRIPFIWMTDAQGTLQQAAIPFALVSHCRERLDNWQYIQELGGVNSYHVNTAIERAKAEWDEQNQQEIARLRQQMESEVEAVRRGEAGKAMDRLVNVLLDLDALPTAAPTARPAKTEKAAAATIEAPIDAPAAAATPKKEAETESDEVWVESFRCTTCNDCIDQLPAVFKYNSDKQAEVHNPKAGTYAKIVTLAEKCPAKCIHPGLPQNMQEPGVEDLIKRAKAIH